MCYKVNITSEERRKLKRPEIEKLKWSEIKVCSLTLCRKNFCVLFAYFFKNLIVFLLF